MKYGKKCDFYEMKNFTRPFQNPIMQAFILCTALMVCFSFLTENRKAENEDPDTDYFSMRNASYGLVPDVVKAQMKARLINEMAREKAAAIGSMPAWQMIGPANTGGRIVDIEMPRGSDSIIYAAAASGGIFKSYDF